MSKNILKLLTLCLALLVGESAVWAATTVNLWHSYRAKEKKAIEEAAAQFNAKGGDVEIKLLYVPYDAFADKITAAMPRGKGPDLFIFAQDRVGDWAASEVIEPLDFWIDRGARGGVPRADARGDDLRRRVYGLPMSFKMVALFYNKKLVKTPPKTTDELIATAKALTNPDAKKFGLVYENANFYYQGMWMQGFGGRVFDRSGKPDPASEQSSTSMKFAQKLAHQSGDHARGDRHPGHHALQQRTGRDGHQRAVVHRRDRERDYGVAVLPTITATGKPATPFLTSEGIIMSAKAKDKKAAFEVMKYLTSVGGGPKIMAKGRQTVARKRRSTTTLRSRRTRSWPCSRRQLAELAPDAQLARDAMVWSPATTAMNKIINGGMDPAAAMTEAQAEVAELVKGARR
jgi:arabinogalactan oligomer/maltooligosaccharide transport system substrate-binding protein